MEATMLDIAQVPETEIILMPLTVSSELDIDTLKSCLYARDDIRFVVNKMGVIHLAVDSPHLVIHNRTATSIGGEHIQGIFRENDSGIMAYLRNNSLINDSLIHKIGLNIDDAADKCRDAIKGYLGIK